MTAKNNIKKRADVQTLPLVFVARKSTGKQENSIEVQRSEVTAWATLMKRDVLQDARFEATESGKVRGRESVTAALAEIKAGRASGVIVTKLDRLGRSLEELLRIERQIRELGGSLVVIKEQVDTSTAQGRFFFSVLGAVAEFERELIAQRITDTAAELRKQGRHVTGHTPLGYTTEERDGKKYLVASVAEQQTVALIRQLAGAMPPGKVADELNRRGIAPRSGRSWHRTQVVRILARDAG